jgi:hypothetical protein
MIVRTGMPDAAMKFIVRRSSILSFPDTLLCTTGAHPMVGHFFCDKYQIALKWTE